MLYESQIRLKVDENLGTPLYLSPSYDSTYVLACAKVDQSEHILHLDQFNKILQSFPFQSGSKAFGMITNFQVLVVQKDLNKITKINLKEQCSQSFHHQFVFSQSDSKQLHIFSERKLICISESSSGRLRLTYYSYPFIKSEQDRIAAYESSQKAWMLNYKLQKGDNRSLMIWFRTRHQQALEFQTFRIRNDGEGQANKYVIRDSSFEPLRQYQTVITSDFWYARNEYFLACFTTKESYSTKSHYRLLQVDTKSESLKTLTYNTDSTSFLTQSCNLGSYVMLGIYTFPATENNTIESANIYLDHDNFQVVDKRRWPTLVHAFPLGFDNSISMIIFPENQSQSDITIRLTKVMKPKEVMLHFMLHINEDFDDDLLQDALQLLELI